eukprot:174116-Chlamydomonas_euryale.AAC.1
MPLQPALGSASPALMTPLCFALGGAGQGVGLAWGLNWPGSLPPPDPRPPQTQKDARPEHPPPMFHPPTPYTPGAPTPHTPSSQGHQDYVTALAWKPTSPMDVLASAASTDKDRTVRFWDVRAASSRCTSVLSVPSGCVSLAWSPDGTTLAVANNKDNSVAFVDVRKSK